MNILRTFPAYASGNCDFVTQRTSVEGDERVVVLDVDVDTLPSGTACLHSNTVAMMVAKLGWKLHTDADEAELIQARRDLAETLERLEAYRWLVEALERVFNENPAAPEGVPALEVVK
jgi:hypothetical protein